MNKPLLFAALSVLLALGACQQSAPDASAQPPLAGARIGGPFTLVNQDGETVTDRDFAGRYRLMYFGYTFCPDVCPVDLQKLMAGYGLLEKRAPAKAAKLQPIFVTIDPARDTPAVMKAYVSAFHPKLIGLTGSEDAIASTAREFAIAYGRADGGDSTSYLMNHSAQAYLMDPKGEPIALIAQDGSPEQIADELERWIR